MERRIARRGVSAARVRTRGLCGRLRAGASSSEAPEEARGRERRLEQFGPPPPPPPRLKVDDFSYKDGEVPLPPELQPLDGDDPDAPFPGAGLGGVGSMVGEDGEPDWVKIIAQAKEEDPAWKEILDGVPMNADAIKAAVRKNLHRRHEDGEEPPFAERPEQEERVRVVVRKVVMWDLWVWCEFDRDPDEKDRGMIEEVFKAWYLLGRLGAFDEANVQFSEEPADVSNLKFKNKTFDDAEQPAAMHEMGNVEFKGRWARCWFDIGIADHLALDALVNSLTTLSDELTPLKQICIGGVNADWAEGTQPKKSVPDLSDLTGVPPGGFLDEDRERPRAA